MTLKTFTITLLLTASFLLFTACDSKTNTNNTNDQNPTSQDETLTGTTDDEGTNSGRDTVTAGGTIGSSRGSTDGNTKADTSPVNGDDGTVTAGGDDDIFTTPTVTMSSLKLTVDKTTLNKDENATVKVIATYSDNSTQEVTDKVEWVVAPNTAVKVTHTTLTALQDKTVIVKAKMNTVGSDALNLNITWIVNGHRLPPEPDKAVNDTTLLGVDVDGNGIRDDVERKIYLTYDKEIERKMLMQEAKLQQSRLADPNLIKNAVEWEKKGDKALGCISYIYDKYDIDLYENTDFLSEATFTTKDRARKYMNYNHALSGGVYGMDNYLRVESSCDFNVTKALKSDK